MKKIFKIFIFLFAFLFLSGCISPSPKEFEQTEFSILNLQTKKELKFNEFIDEISKFDIVLLGENHGDNSNRFLESKICRDLALRHDLTAVLEMISDDKNDKLQTSKENKENIKPNELRKAIDWEKSWKWRDYGYMVENLFYSDIKMSSGNLSKDEIDLIFKGAQELKGKYSVAPQVKEKIKQAVILAHPIKDEDADKFVQAQQYKDRRMADKLVNAKTQKAVLIAGSFHINKEVGVPLHLKDYKTPKKWVVVYLYDDKKSDLKNTDYIIREKK